MPRSLIIVLLASIISAGGCDHRALMAAETAEAWGATQYVNAPEAFQAAASDTDHVYAIASTEIAKYDRQMGRRLAVSQGEARHLNSGFLWEGKLYCAHSNYPQTPEQSQVKVLDLKSMQLTTLRDLSDLGGSLTWVVRHDEHWWCNFAGYGDQQARTVLVQFDHAWHEQARWTYPAEVLRQLGNYSLSGGIWLGQELLVTGHDDPVLFRLRLPREGHVLEYLGTQRIPFTGQGIAIDPRSGGLVGIDRPRRQVVFAARQPDTPRLRVLTYNIHHGEGIDRQLDLERLVRVIVSVAPDVVALQEVEQRTRRTGMVDQPAELARLTKMRVVFGGNIPFEGGEYGNAVLSRYPILRHQNHLLPCLDDGEQRGVLEVEIAWPNAGVPLRLLATHLDHRANDRERVASARRINEILGDRDDAGTVLAGDLNDLPDSATLIELARRWTRSNVEVEPTIPVERPTRQIDYVLYAPADRWRVIETQVLLEAVASDHRAVLAVLEYIPPAPVD